MDSQSTTEEGSVSGATSASVVTSEVLRFSDAQESVSSVWASVSDPTFDVGSSDTVSLAGWLARPVNLMTLNWTNSPLDVTLDPWTLFLSKPSIVEKIKHFAYFRGNLHVRLVINGSPFLYGRTIVAYLPSAPVNTAYNLLDINCNLDYPEPISTYLSQVQHEYLDPSTNHSVDMVCPFISPKNWARLFRGDGSAFSAQTLPDIQALGRMRVFSMNELREGNTPSGAPNVTVSVFAWMEDVKLAVPTSTELAPATIFYPEGKKRSMDASSLGEEKQAAQGVSTVSGIASAVATGLGALSNVAIIGPFATAGSIAAGAISNVAKIFGFSRPMQLGDTQRFFPEPIANTAASVGAFTGYKLAVDPHNTVTLDPRVGNMPCDDELSIQSIAQRESYLTTFAWTDTNSVITNSATLFRCAVTPYLHSTTPAQPTLGGQMTYSPTPMAFAVEPFAFWRGTMKIRFQVVASQYHRGKVAVFYEPNMKAQDTVTAVNDLDFNTHFTHIFDLQELENAEITIPWSQPNPFCEVHKLTSSFTSNGIPYFPNPQTPAAILLSIDQKFCNGFIEVRVVNELASALAVPSPIEINVFVSMEDLQVAAPRVMSTNQSMSTPAASPATIWYLEGDMVDKFDVNETGAPSYLMEPSDDSKYFQVFFGENIRSFRPLLKRFNEEFRGDTSTTLTEATAVMSGFLYPITSLYSPTSMATGTVRPSTITMFDYLRYAYVGVRGSTRRVISPLDGFGSIGSIATTNALVNNTFPFYVLSSASGSVPSISTSGGALGFGSVNPVSSFESPYYSSNRFWYAFNSSYQYDPLVTVADDGLIMNNVLPGWSYRALYNSNQTTGTFDVNFGVSFAAGDDMTFMCYQAAPPKFYLP